MITVDIEGELPNLAAIDENMDEVVERIAEIMLDGVRRQFGEGGTPKKWHPLADGKPSFLFQSGTLLRSIQATTGSQGEVFWAQVSTTGGLPYAAIHQFSGWTGRGHKSYMHARPYMVITEENKARILEETLGMLVTFLNANGEKIKWS